MITHTLAVLISYVTWVIAYVFFIVMRRLLTIIHIRPLLKNTVNGNRNIIFDMYDHSTLILAGQNRQKEKPNFLLPPIAVMKKY